MVQPQFKSRHGFATNETNMGGNLGGGVFFEIGGTHMFFSNDITKQISISSSLECNLFFSVSYG